MICIQIGRLLSSNRFIDCQLSDAGVSVFRIGIKLRKKNKLKLSQFGLVTVALCLKVQPKEKPKLFRTKN